MPVLVGLFAIVLVGALVTIGVRGSDASGALVASSPMGAAAEAQSDSLVVTRDKMGSDVEYESPEVAAAVLRDRLDLTVDGVRRGALSLTDAFSSICRETDEVLSNDIGVSPFSEEYFNAQTVVLDVQMPAFRALRELADDPRIVEYVDLIAEVKPLAEAAGPLTPKAIPEDIAVLVQRMRVLSAELNIGC